MKMQKQFMAKTYFQILKADSSKMKITAGQVLQYNPKKLRTTVPELKLK